MMLGTNTMHLVFERHFKRFLPRDGVTFRNRSHELAGLHISGPNAQAFIARLAERDMDTADFPFM